MMDGSHGGSNAPAPFLIKTYEMVEDPVTDSIVSWSQSGHSFVVWNPPEFARDLLPTYFKHNNFSSFVRQLNTYGFRKIDPDQWEFANEEFIRGQRHLLPRIHRRKPIHSHSLQHQGNSSNPLNDSERQEFEEEIERLKRDKSLLQSELQKHKQESQGYEVQVRSFGERVKNIEQRQRQTITFLAQLLQNSSSSSTIAHLSENGSKKRRLEVSNYLYDEANIEGNQISTIQKENQDTMSMPVLSSELIQRLDSSLKFWESFLHGVGQTSGEEIYGFGVQLHPSPIVITEMNVSSRDSDINGQQHSPSLHLSSPQSRDIHSSSEFAASSDHADSPAISSIYVNLDCRPNSSGIDVNAKPAYVLDIDASYKIEEGNRVPAQPGANDIFWEQFLTETPGSDPQEVQSDRRETDGTKSEIKLEGQHRFWWNRDNVDNLTKQMGHLTPAERT